MIAGGRSCAARHQGAPRPTDFCEEPARTPANTIDDEPSDSELLQRWIAGDTAAASSVVERNQVAVSKYVRAHFRGDAEDLTQETFLICFTNASQFRGDSDLRTFLLGIAHRLILAARRASFKVRSCTQDLTTSVDPGGFENANSSLLKDAMQRLPAELLTPLALAYVAGLTEDEIAQSLGCPRGTIASRLRRGKRALRALLRAPLKPVPGPREGAPEKKIDGG
jgi:RNA polymerase sigma factor (sigma-70 family)